MRVRAVLAPAVGAVAAGHAGVGEEEHLVRARRGAGHVRRRRGAVFKGLELALQVHELLQQAAARLAAAASHWRCARELAGKRGHLTHKKPLATGNCDRAVVGRRDVSGRAARQRFAEVGL